MSEYWKSNAKKFCEICKVWFADNKISIENHERGLKHKGMVQARLREISKKANETERANEKLASTLMQMEQAAFMSMNGAARSSNAVGPSPNGGAIPKIEKLSEYEEAKAKVKAEKERMKQLKRTSKKSTIWVDDEEQQTDTHVADVNDHQNEGIQWVETIAEDGRKYYFHIYSGDTRWDAPENYYTMEQYQQYYSQSAASTYSDVLPPTQPSSSAEILPKIENKYEEIKAEKEPVKILKRTANVSEIWYKNEEQPTPIPVKRAANESPNWNNDEEQSNTAFDTPANTHSVGLLGPWVPVEKKPEIVAPKQEKPRVILDDLPEEASQVQDVQPTFDELEYAELKFEERKAPIISSKKTKVVEFKKRKTMNRSVRAREEF